MLQVESGKKLVGGLVKVGIDLLNLEVGSALKELVDTVLELRRPPETVIDAEAALGLLIRRAAAEAAVTVFRDFRHVASAAGAVSAAELAAQLRAAQLPLPTLDHKTFAAPQSWAAAAELERLFAGWLDACRIPKKRRGEMARAFAAELPFALRGEWLHAENARDYRALVAALNRDSPFDKAADDEGRWRDYRAKLAADIRQPLRSIAPDVIPRFALEQLYVPLRAVWRESKTAHEREAGKGRLTYLHDALADWIAAADPADWVRVVTGGPGSGKSSACRMLAADLARQGRRVLLVPLGRVEYAREAAAALEKWALGALGHDPLSREALRAGDPVVLILDGLDELVKTGKVGEDIVRNFVTELHQRARNLNENGLRVLLLLVGRPLAAEQGRQLASKPQAWLEAQPFIIDPRELDDPDKIGDIDQRDDWWRKFGRDGLPENLRQDERLHDVTAQPLLNWLLAQVLTLNADEDIGGVHGLYQRLLDEVLKRSHRDRVSEAADALADGEMARLLEEVAVAAWHDGDRSVKLSTIRDRLTAPGLKAALDKLCRKDENAAIETVLDSFFCAPVHGGAEQRVFEFTHKSFREFLTVRRLLREVADMHGYLAAGARYGVETPLRDWFALCGPTAMTWDLLTALRDAAAALDFAAVDQYAAAMRTLLLHSSHHGFPLPQKGDWNTKELDRQARNAEEALLAVHSSSALAYIAKHPDGQPPPLALDWGEDGGDKAGQWLHRLTGRCEHIAAACLNNCNFLKLKYFRENISFANLSFANLSYANIPYANIPYANFFCANLFSADLSVADLSIANLSGANLFCAYLSHADLSHADLSGANLSYADLSHANFSGANLEGVRGLTDEELADLKRRAAKRPDAN